MSDSETKLDLLNASIEVLDKAYPEDMFPPLSFDEMDLVQSSLKECGVDAASSRLHAQWGRHLVKCIKEGLC